MSDYRTLTDQIDRMRKAGHHFDSVNLSTLLAWHGEQMAMQREIDRLQKLLWPFANLNPPDIERLPPERAWMKVDDRVVTVGDLRRAMLAFMPGHAS